MSFNINLTLEEVNLIGAALGQCPYSQVVALINKLQSQIVEQENPVKEDVVL